MFFLFIYFLFLQVLLHWLREPEDKWRCGALYFHGRMLFFHLIGLSSHSMRRRQWGNEKWTRKNRARWKKEIKHQCGTWGGPTADDLPHETHKNGRECRTCLNAVFIYRLTMLWQEGTKVRSRLHVDEERTEARKRSSSPLAFHPFSFMFFWQCAKSNKNMMWKTLLSFLVSSFHLSCHFIQTP